MHRDADYKSCVPKMSQECLQKELDFYQLPSLEELGLDVAYCSFASKENAARDLVSRIFCEIEATGMKNMYPWDICIYRRIVDGKFDGDMNVFLHFADARAQQERIIDRGHKDFDTAMYSSHLNCTRSLFRDWLIVRPRGTTVCYAVMLAISSTIGILKSELEKFGLAVSSVGYSVTNNSGNSMDCDIFRLEYKAD